MATELPRYHFTVDQYHQLAEVGILDWEERYELLGGIIMTMHPTTRQLFTVNDLHRMAEMGIVASAKRIELVEGELMKMPDSDPVHARAVERVSALLTRLVGDEAIVKTHTPLQFHERMLFRPDIMLLDKRLGDGASPSSPKDVCLLIEIAGSDSLSYIRRFKMPFYARAAIVEVWVVNMERDCLEVRTFANPAQGTYEFIERSLRGGPARFLQMVANARVKVGDLLASARGAAP